MDRHFLMGIDLGSSGVRSVVVDARDGCAAAASRVWTFPRAEHPSGLGYDIDLDLTWADNMYRGGQTGGDEPFKSRVLSNFAAARRDSFL